MRFQETALMAAASVGDEEIVRLLLSHSPDKIDVNLTVLKDCGRGASGQTALQKALDRGCIGIVRILLERDEIDIYKYGCSTPLLDQCTSYSFKNIQTALLFAQSDKDLITSLLDRDNFDATLQSYNGFTALIWAAENGYADSVCVLIPRAEIGISRLRRKYGSYARCF
ncbi:ankyrin repeat-containing domain protein [Pyronema domesticum]|nr:ankyrin repeat-containing domain protein [Pyronema domesticum]